VRVQTSKRFLERYAREGDRFLQSIITCDESWLHLYDPETKPSQWCRNIHHHLHQRRLRTSSLLNMWCSCFLQTTVWSFYRMTSQKIRRSTQRITKRYRI